MRWIHSGHYDEHTFDKGSYVIAGETKSPSELTPAESQLLADLGMMRIAAWKGNPLAQETDGREYQFIAINNHGLVRMSERHRFIQGANRKMIYNWIITMMDTAIRGTASASPITYVVLRDQEINQCDNTVWRRSYNAVVQLAGIKAFDDDTMVFTVLK